MDRVEAELIAAVRTARASKDQKQIDTAIAALDAYRIAKKKSDKEKK